jgi:hypothetical protein
MALKPRLPRSLSEDNHIFQLAVDAISQSDGAPDLYDQIIRKLSADYNGDQKEIAQALQSLAKRIEQEKGADSAFVFKQRSCEVFLVFNMEMRRSGRSAAAAANPTATVSATVDDSLSAKALASVKSTDATDSERLVTEIIEELKSRHSDNQREIAAELQAISKRVEAKDAQAAFSFKQKSCEVMLKMSMASRRLKPQ